MNGYEFTRFEADFTSQVKASMYEAPVVAMQAERCSQNYKEEPDYLDAKEWFIETTMSCNQEEAINWMKYYMTNAIAYGIATKNLDWRTKFLAAWDLFESLTKGRYAMTNTQARFLQNA